MKRSERRKFSWKTIVGSMTHRRRHSARRDEDFARGYYSDKICRPTFIASMFFMLFCTLDAIFTLTIIGVGGTEINPIMDYFLQISPLTFLVAKAVLTLSGIIFLWHHRHFSLLRIARGRHAIYAMNLIYGSLVAYELYILIASENLL